MAKSSQEIQRQIDELKKAKSVAVEKEKEALKKKHEKLSNKVKGIFNSCVNSVVRDWHGDECREFLSDILYEDGQFDKPMTEISFWNTETVIDEKIESEIESLEVHTQLLEGLKEFKEEMKKQFDK